ncbi:hypothetical protein Fcan01_16976 [Folsomia candida]|uniref:MULE transposase domain-containing protein n=2 Tax=Folsomia candida TaxID=158441 RepID=A0A226DT58_FOLCA|nr:hypothetical protein Fcan01_16976 [Folsomia candida]
MSDFEVASRNGWLHSFPESEARSCFFHFRQANYRRIQHDADLMELESNATFSLNLRSLIALAFIPPSDVSASFEELLRSDFFEENKDTLDNYVSYFRNTWIGAFDPAGTRQTPMFPIPLWNCYLSVLRGLPKTNNYCEGFHRGFSSMLSVHHPTLPKLVTGLLKEQAITTFKSEQFVAAIFEKPPKSVMDQRDRLKTAVDRYGKIPRSEYIRGICHCIALK